MKYYNRTKEIDELNYTIAFFGAAHKVEYIE